MPTNKPRITITLSDRQHRLLENMAEVQGVSMSSIVVELLETAEPVLERVLEMLEAAKKAPQAALKELKRSLDLAESQVGRLQSEAFGQLDLLVATAEGSPLPGARTDGARRAPAKKAAKPRTRPHPTNRGVRFPATSQNPTAKKTTKASPARGKK